MKNVLRTIKDQDTLELDDIIKGLEAEEKLAPEPMKKKSRAFYLYDIVRSLGGTTTLNDIWKLTPASDLTKPKNKRELREWISSSCVSKGYIHKVASDVYRIATLEEYERILARNKASAKKYTARVKAKELRAARKEAKKQVTTQSVEIESIMPPRAPTPTKPVGRPVVKQPEPKQPEPSRSFANQYLGSLLGTSVAIILFYVIVRVI
tara:strand:+ start:9 stop:632 length:624 start_codon:yes stop_codon:yes gene_type:complete